MIAVSKSEPNVKVSEERQSAAKVHPFVFSINKTQQSSLSFVCLQMDGLIS